MRWNDLEGGIPNAVVRTARFDGRILKLNQDSIRVFGPNASFAQDLEPEYIAVSDDSRVAWVTLQEANAIARLDIEEARFVTINGLGSKDHSLPENQLDPSDRDGGIHIANWTARGMYQPDAIAFFKIGPLPFLVVANEGDARSYTGFSEEVRVKDANLDPTAFPDAADLKQDSKLGRLTVTRTGDIDNDGDLDYLQPFGARSFSISNVLGGLVWDSGDELENQTAVLALAVFNSDGTAASFDTRSDNKGPEPEGVVVGKVSGRTYAFIGLERIGGIIVYDITLPWSPNFVHSFTMQPQPAIFRRKGSCSSARKTVRTVSLYSSFPTRSAGPFGSSRSTRTEAFSFGFSFRTNSTNTVSLHLVARFLYTPCRAACLEDKCGARLFRGAGLLPIRKYDE